MKHINLRIITPENILYEGEVSSLILPGSDGSFGVYPNHAPIVSKLKAGDVKIEGGSESTVQIEGGFFYLDEGHATVLATH